MDNQYPLNSPILSRDEKIVAIFQLGGQTDKQTYKHPESQTSNKESLSGDQQTVVKFSRNGVLPPEITILPPKVVIPSP